ncbi:MAG: glycosyltransferase family 39 protein [Synechococcaceae cyanobacterium]|nr:glycosyltransferase family 39 protein [Synechococcaceae cyanobacterium]
MTEQTTPPSAGDARASGARKPARAEDGAASPRPPRVLPWGLLLAGLWGLATAADRLWLSLDARLPGWDQADYLNSAVDHGRALGLLAGGGWQGWQALLDLSPKIPPLASLVNGTVMAVAGSRPDQAAWALALWHGLLLVVVACWGRQLAGAGFGLLAAALVALTPALAELRVDFTLDLPLTATSTLALWRLGCWQAPAPRGGRWHQALTAALAVAVALLVKQSALLVVALPCLWAAGRALGEGRRSRQAVVGLAVVVGLCLPWLHHNWITALGGTNRAVLESGAAEGDPPPLSRASLLWYWRRWPLLVGPVLPFPALLGALAALAHRWRHLPAFLGQPVRHLPPGWAWLIGCTISGWACTTLSPNKDLRYIAPVLPLLVLLLARGWWQVGMVLRRRPPALPCLLLAAGLTAAADRTVAAANRTLQRQEPAPVAEVMAALRGRVGTSPTTVGVVPSSPEVNEHTLTTFGRLDGGRIAARKIGRDADQHPLVLDRSPWILLASGDQGTPRPAARELSHRVRADPRFEKVGSWPWSEERQLELWRRRGAPGRFDADFIRLARGMEAGPAGLARVFERIGPEHQLDPHFLYQERVRGWAEQRLRSNPRDADALWSLALLATLRNRPAEAEHWFGALQARDPQNPWPAAYRAVVLLAGWNPWKANSILQDTPETVRRQAVVRGLGDLSRLLGGQPLAVADLRRSLPAAITEVEASLERQEAPEGRAPE